MTYHEKHQEILADKSISDGKRDRLLTQIAIQYAMGRRNF